MMNVVAKRCIYNGCSKYASFNVNSSKELLYCAEHKTDIMQNIIRFIIIFSVKIFKKPVCGISVGKKL